MYILLRILLHGKLLLLNHKELMVLAPRQITVDQFTNFMSICLKLKVESSRLAHGLSMVNLEELLSEKVKLENSSKTEILLFLWSYSNLVVLKLLLIAQQ